MGFTNPFTNVGASSGAASAGVAARNRLLGSAGGGTATKDSNPLAKAGDVLKQRWNGIQPIALGAGSSTNGANAAGLAARNRMLGITPEPKEESTVTAEQVAVDPGQQAIEDAGSQWMQNNHPYIIANQMDWSPNSDMDLYNTTLNRWNDQGNASIQNAVGAINNDGLDAAYGQSTADLIRSLSGQGDAIRRSTGASMATRGLAGSGAYNSAMNDIGANVNRQTASGLTGLFDTYMGKKQANQQAIANIYGQQAANQYGTGQQAATSQVANKYGPLNNATSFQTIRDLVNQLAVQPQPSAMEG